MTPDNYEPITSEELAIIAEALRKPTQHALADLEQFKTRPNVLDHIRDLEISGKCRWPLTNQVKLWLAALKPTPTKPQFP